MARKFLRNIGSAWLLFITVTAFVQTPSSYEGDVLISFLGKNAYSPELKDLKANYKCEMANEAHYLSKGGIELILKNGTLNEIHLYGSSAVYGSFTGKLPRNLHFGMTTAEVRKVLGKPIVSYNSGYCEYEYSNYILSCWFDGSKLNQMGVTVKVPL